MNKYIFQHPLLCVDSNTGDAEFEAELFNVEQIGVETC